MLQILNIEPITWCFYRPAEPKDFPCMLCHRKIATTRLKCQLKSAIINLSVCGNCVTMSPIEIMDKIKD